MNNEELQEVVDSILQAMLSMEERINKKFEAVDKRFDEIDDKLDRLETKIEKIEGDVLDMGIVKATVDKHDYDIKKIKSAM